jgi:outer membrane protein insertion porin family
VPPSFFLLFSLAATDLIQSVSIRGGHAPVTLSTRAGKSYDARSVERDVKELYATGRFADVRVESLAAPGGRQITFHVIESGRRRLGELRIVPEDFPLKARVETGELIDPMRAQSIAVDFRRQLDQYGYKDARVEAELAPRSDGTADLLLHITSGAPTRVGEVRILGETALPSSELRRELKALRSRRILPPVPGIWAGWIKRPPYSQAAVESDVARLQSFYISRGYFDATVRLDHTRVSNNTASVSLLVRPGSRYTVAGGFDAPAFCGCLMQKRREAEKRGVVDFSARVRLVPQSENKVELAISVDTGRAFVVRRIDFSGNRRFSDKLIRSHLLLDEAAPLDTTLVRKSLDRLNRSMLFEPLNESDVDVTTNAATGVADLRLRLKERKPGSWLLSGPVGPMSIAGPLQFVLASRLPAWGKGVLDLSTYHASFQVLAYGDPLSKLLGITSDTKARGVAALQRPFLPAQGWTSGVTIAPQLGWRSTALTYGATQARERLLPRMRNDALPAPPLPVTIERRDGEATLLCETPRPRLERIRRITTLALGIAMAGPGL